MREILFLIKTDAYRYMGSVSLKNCVKAYLRISGFRFMVWHRIANKCKLKNRCLYVIPWFVLSRLKYKYGYDIPAETQIGKGFYIGHFGGIVISSEVRIGDNCNISQGVTIGFNSRGNKKGYPKIGNEVYIGPGAKIIGGIKIDNNAAIGANAVVLNDIPAYGVAVGVPSIIISLKGSEGYIQNVL